MNYQMCLGHWQCLQWTLSIPITITAVVSWVLARYCLRTKLSFLNIWKVLFCCRNIPRTQTALFFHYCLFFLYSFLHTHSAPPKLCWLFPLYSSAHHNFGIFFRVSPRPETTQSWIHLLSTWQTYAYGVYILLVDIKTFQCGWLFWWGILKICNLRCSLRILNYSFLDTGRADGKNRNGLAPHTLRNTRRPWMKEQADLLCVTAPDSSWYRKQSPFIDLEVNISKLLSQQSIWMFLKTPESRMHQQRTNITAFELESRPTIPTDSVRTQQLLCSSGGPKYWLASASGTPVIYFCGREGVDL